MTDHDTDSNDQLSEQPFAKKFKHTLDSDEEDDEQVREKYDILDPDRIEGEEDGDVRDEAEVQITPFNMKDELEEGHFDKQGMFIFKKDPDQIQDHWLDNIDWVKVEERATAATKPDSEPKPDHQFDLKDNYRRIVSLLKPGETVKQAIRRLGQSASSAKRKKSNSETDDGDESKNIAKEEMMNLISLADELISSGDMDAYERTFEQLTFRLKDSDAALDMFSEKDQTDASTSKTEAAIESVAWELRWSDADDAEVHGPFPNEQMLQWRDAGYFANGAFVRQVGKAGAVFHSANRIDFDLYS
jgi:CD2 antigen cytoplasmic tail-binding protein 2